MLHDFSRNDPYAPGNRDGESEPIRSNGLICVTWSDCTGLDPDANLSGQSTGSGLEYFNHPQPRTFLFTFTLSR